MPNRPRITRRRLVFGAGAAGVGLAGGGAVVLTGVTAAPGSRFLSARESAIVAAIARVMFPGAPFPLDGVQAGVPAEVDRILADVLAPIHATGFRTLLHALEWGTLASRGRPFTALGPEEATDVLARWLDPAVFTRRLAADSFRVVLGMAYFAHPDVLAHMGWRSGCGGGAS